MRIDVLIAVARPPGILRGVVHGMLPLGKALFHGGGVGIVGVARYFGEGSAQRANAQVYSAAYQARHGGQAGHYTTTLGVAAHHHAGFINPRLLFEIAQHGGGALHAIPQVVALRVAGRRRAFTEHPVRILAFQIG